MIDHNSYIADVPELEALTGKDKELRRRFVLEYVSDPKRNGTRAAIRAGYEAGKDKASAMVAASRLLSNDKVIAAIKAMENKIGGPECLPRLEAVLNAIIYTDMSDVMRWDGRGRVTLVSSDQLSPTAAAAIAQVQDIREEQQRRLPLGDEQDVAVDLIKRNVKLHDKLRAIEILARIKGLYAPEKRAVEVGGRVEHGHDLSSTVDAALAALTGIAVDRQGGE